MLIRAGNVEATGREEEDRKTNTGKKKEKEQKTYQGGGF